MRKDPIGAAIKDYSVSGISKDIIVSSDLCEDDVIPSDYLFRSFDEMPEIEQIALGKASGSILDVGSAAGAHATYLSKKGENVTCIDVSEGSVEFLRSCGHDARVLSFFDIKNEKYDTILLLMNGLGIAGKLENLENFLDHAKSLLNDGGKMLCDSTDIKYLYEDDEGGYWMDLNSEYYGNFHFKMKFDDNEGDWFNWLYVDFDTLKEVAEKVGLQIEKIFEEETHYLAELKF